MHMEDFSVIPAFPPKADPPQADAGMTTCSAVFSFMIYIELRDSRSISPE